MSRMRPVYLIAAISCFFFSSLMAQQWLINTSNDPVSSPYPGTLRYALLNAQAGDEITFENGIGIIYLGAPLPAITEKLTIDTKGENQQINGNSLYNGFFIASGAVSVSNVTFADCTAVGGNGGASGNPGGGGAGLGGGVFIGGTSHVTLSSVIFSNCSAIGGSGGTLTVQAGGSGGGGILTKGGDVSGGGVTGGAGGGAYETAGSSNVGTVGGTGGEGVNGTIVGGSGGNAGGGSGSPGSNASIYGGGGGGGASATGIGGTGGNGGFGGGGGGAGAFVGSPESPLANGGNGGFGGGGGSASGSGASGGNGGYNGGTGGSPYGGGGGGAMGGALFISNGATLIVQNKEGKLIDTLGTVTRGLGSGSGAPGVYAGEGFFLMSGSSTTFNVSPGATLMVASNLMSDQGGGGGSGGGITVTGGGTLQLLGANNSYSGITTVNGAELSGNTNSLVSSISTESGGIVTFNQSGISGTYSYQLSGTGNLQVTGNGTLILNSGNTYTGTTTIYNGATLQIGPGVVPSNNTIINNGSLIFNQSTGPGVYSGPISGVGGLTLMGGNNLTLSGANSYTGLTTVSTGTLNVTTSSVVGNILNNGSVVFNQNVAGSYGGNISGSGPVTINGNGAITMTGTNSYTGGTTVALGSLIGTTSSIQGNITNNASISFNQDTTGTYAGNMSGSGSVTISGSGNVIMTGTNSYFGGTTLVAGFTEPTLTGTTASIQGNIDNGGTVAFNQSGSGAFSGTISGYGSVTIVGSGTVTFNTPNFYTQGTTIQGGTLSISSEANIGGAASAISLQGGTLIVTGNTNISGYNYVSANSAINVSGGQTLTFSGPMIGTNSCTLSLTGSGTTSMGQVLVSNGNVFNIAGVLGGSQTLTKTGSATLTLNSANTYSGGTVISQGTIDLVGSSSASLGSGSVSMSNGTTLQVDVNGVSLNNLFSLTGTDNFNITTGTTTLSNTISGAGNLTKIGGGTLVLSGSNSYSLGTTLNGGTLSISSPSNIGGASGAVTLNSGTLLATSTLTSSGAFSVTGSSTMSVASGQTMSLTGTLTGSSGTTLTVAGSGTLSLSTVQVNTGDIFTITGGLGGSTTLTKVGNGTLAFNSPNNFTNGVSLQAGSIELANSSTTLGSGTIAMSGGTYLISQVGGTSLSNNITVLPVSTVDVATGSMTLSGNITSTGSLAKTGTGQLILSGTNSYSGGTLVSSGTLAGTTTSLQGAITNNASLIFNQSTNGTYAGQITGTGSVIKQGTGNVTFSGSNGYSGGTLVSAGTLTGTTTSLQGAITNNALLVFNQSGSGSYNGNLSGTGSVTIQGGSVTFGGTNSYSGGTLISTGSLIGTTSSLQGAITNNSSLVFSQNTNGTYGGQITGAGSLQKTGTGTVTFTGNNSTFTGPTTVQQGALSVNGTLGGTTTTVPGGTASGTGTFAALINNGAVLPGNSIGTLNVSGNYQQGSGGNLEMEISSNGAGDKLAVTGSAALDGTFTVLPDPGIYEQGTQYHIITGAPVSGTFATLTTPTTLSYKLVYTPTEVILEVTKHSPIIPPVPPGPPTPGNNPIPGNKGNVVSYLFCSTAPTDPDLLSVQKQLLTLSGEQFLTALSYLDPVPFSDLPYLEVENTSRIVMSYTERIKRFHQTMCVIDNETSHIWLEPIGFFYHQDGVGSEQVGFNAETYGVSFGGERGYDNGFVVGAGGSYSYSHLKWRDHHGKAHSNVLYFGPFLAWQYNNAYVETAILGAINFYHTDRNILFPGFSRTADANFHTWDLVNTLDLGKKFFIDKRKIFVEPFAEVMYIQSFQQSFKESGADSVNLAVSHKYRGFLRADVELRLGRLFCFNGGSITPTAMIGWMYTAPMTSGSYTSSFNGEALCTPNFQTHGMYTAPSEFRTGASLSGSIGESSLISAQYTFTVGDTTSVQEGRFQYQFTF